MDGKAEYYGDDMVNTSSVDAERGYGEKDHVYVDEATAVPGDSFTYGDSIYARIQRFAGKLNIEQRGIERVPEDERTDTNLANVGTMVGIHDLEVFYPSSAADSCIVSGLLQTWSFPPLPSVPSPFQFLISVSSIPSLPFSSSTSWESLLSACFQLSGPSSVCVRWSYLASSSGSMASKLVCPLFSSPFLLDASKADSVLLRKVAFFNILACVGWSSVNVIVGAQLLNAVNSNVPGYAGIIIIAGATFIVTLFGYKVVHAYEFWSWIPCFVIFLIVLGEFAHSGRFSNIPMGVGSSEAGSILSFAASVFGFATGWTSYAADYTVYQPANVSRVKVFAWTFAGLIFPLCFTEMLGLAVMTASLNTPSYADGYKNAGIGGLLAAVLFPRLGRFGEFCLVVLALSIVANNCPNIYSVTFSLQVMARWTQAVPRFIWTFVGTLIYCAIAIPGYSHFESVLENFMLLIVCFPLMMLPYKSD